MIKRLLKTARIFSLILSVTAFAQGDGSEIIKFNKLREMYSFYYLPFNIHFKIGTQPDDVFPVLNDELGAPSKLISPEDMSKIENIWKETRADWKKKSLFLTSNVESGKKVRISPHLVSHKISVQSSALDHLKFSNRLIFQKSLQNQSPEVQKNVTQLFFLDSFLDERDKRNFNFFIFSPSWCASSQEYQAIFEAYYKKFTPLELTIHSVVIDDPNEAIFDSKIFKELFPNPSNYSHDIVPRFLAMEQKEGKTIIYEEGEALSALYEKFFKEHQGFLNSLVKDIIPQPKSITELKQSSTIATLPKMAQ